jgi:pimeloyl-ACP methyl ester carboxylesterase
MFALLLAVQHPDRLDALVLESPSDPRVTPVPACPPSSSTACCPPIPSASPPLRLDPAVLAKQEALVARLRGPDRDADFDLTSGPLHP